MVANEGVVVMIAPDRAYDCDLPINISIKQTVFGPWACDAYITAT